MTPSDVEAIVTGRHGDPFRVLGPHVIETPSGHAWEVRAFLPQAARAEVVIGDVAYPMKKQHSEGLFTARIDGDPRPYRIRIFPWEGDPVEIEDPYRFPLLLTEMELYLHAEGTHYEAYNMLGAHLKEIEGIKGVRFAVWAPNAEAVYVVGDFNDWDTRRHPMRLRDGGDWELFIPGVDAGARYKYQIRSRYSAYSQLKADPYAFASEVPPRSASVVADIDSYSWGDSTWMEARAKRRWLEEPVSIYEVHLGSWLRGPHNELLTYRELADKLISYLSYMGYTHLELLPVMEHPFAGSWGYQVIGFFAPTARFGSPEDFMYLVDRCHQAGIAVIADWVPGHFPKDAHGLAYFDGTALYEHEDPRLGEHKDWGTKIFNYGRNEVRCFLISSALFWLKKYHIDGLRVDAVASMIYLDYSRGPGEWIPNRYGGNENLEAIDFLRRFNELAHQQPGAFTIAEESTAFSGVSRPVYLGGLGFTMKWNMGWMHDTLRYFSTDPLFRKYHQQEITFSLLYAFTENFVLPISHDEVVYGKGSLLGKMPGDEWQRFANVRAFLGYMYGHPGKKLLFMGSEIGQYEEWNHERAVRWELLEFNYHRKLQNLVRELNRLYRNQPALYEVDYEWEGFEWVDFHDIEHSIIAFLRKTARPEDTLLFCCNFTPEPHANYRLGVPIEGFYEELLNTDAIAFGGSGMGNADGVYSTPDPCHGKDHSIAITLPPLAVVVLKRSKAPAKPSSAL